MKISFESREIVKLVGITPRQASYWPLIGIIKPDISDASGRSSRRIYSFWNLMEFEITKELEKSGLELAEIKSIISWLKKNRGEFKNRSFGESKASPSISGSKKSTGKVEDFSVLEGENAGALLFLSPGKGIRKDNKYYLSITSDYRHNSNIESKLDWAGRSYEDALVGLGGSATLMVLDLKLIYDRVIEKLGFKR